MRLRTALSLAAAALALAAPASAAAATYTVDPASSTASCGSSATTCSSLASAIAAAGAGDTVALASGTYTGPFSVPSGKNGLTIAPAPGSAGATITAPAGASQPALSVASDNVTVTGVTISVPASAAEAAAFSGAGDVLDQAVVVRRAPGGSETPSGAALVKVTAGGTTVKLSQLAQTGAGPAVASQATGAGGTTIQDSLVVAAAGAAFDVTGGTGNALTRSYALASGGDGVLVTSAAGDASDKQLAIASSVVNGAHGLHARTDATVLGASGPVTITATHLTTTSGIVLDATANALLGAAGNITATVDNSIVHGTTTVDHYPGLIGTGIGANAASLAYTTVDGPAATGSGTLPTAPATNTPDSALFVASASGNLHLKPSAAVIDQGTDHPAAGVQDIDRQPRALCGPSAPSSCTAANAATDLGADEYENLPPAQPTLGTSRSSATTGQPVTFTATGGTDPDSFVSGGIAHYDWAFGDGSTTHTPGASTTHSYSAAGTYHATVTAVDGLGLAGPASTAVTVTVSAPGSPPPVVGPKVTMTSPLFNQTLPLFRSVRRGGHTVRQRLAQKISGKAEAPSGIRRIQLTLAFLGSSHALPSARATCRWWDGHTRFVRRSCASPILFSAHIADFAWAYRFPASLRLPSGWYVLTLRAVDYDGHVTTAVSSPRHSAVFFRLR